MTKHLNGSDVESPFALDRRSSSRGPDDGRGRWLRRVTLSEIVAAITLLGLLLGLIGWRAYSPAVLDARLTHVELRVDSLANQQGFTNYMLCVQLRRTDPAAVPPGCAPILDLRGRP